MLEMMRFDILMGCWGASLVLALVIYGIRSLAAFVAAVAGLAGTALVAIIKLCLEAVRDWMESKRLNRTDYGRIVAEKLANGNYNVVGGVFSVENRQIASNAWQNVSLDCEIKQRLSNGSGTLIVNLG